MFKKVIANTGAQIVGKVFTATISALIAFTIARSLGASGFGDFTKTFVFVGYFYTLADFGLNSIFVKLDKDNSLFQYLFGLRIVLSTLLVSLAFLIDLFLPYNPQTHVGFSPAVKIAIAI